MPKRTKTNPVLLVILLLILAVSIGLLCYVVMSGCLSKEPIPVYEEIEEEPELPSHEDAELIGFNFMLDFLEIAPPDANEEAIERMYEALSVSAREIVSLENFVEEIPLFIGVQDVPEQGVSVENLIIIDDENAEFITGLNYSSGRILRKLTLVAENGEWKVENVSEYEKSEAEEYIPAVSAVIQFITEKTASDDIQVLSYSEQEWPDGCLGLGGEDEMCTMALVPGYEVVVEVNEETRTFRTDMEGMLIREEL